MVKIIIFKLLYTIFILTFCILYISKVNAQSGTFKYNSKQYGAELSLILNKDSTYSYSSSVFYWPSANKQDSGRWRNINGVIELYSATGDNTFTNNKLVLRKRKNRNMKVQFREEKCSGLFKRRRYLTPEREIIFYKK